VLIEAAGLAETVGLAEAVGPAESVAPGVEPPVVGVGDAELGWATGAVLL
jgi:hypothetical protein